LGLLNRDSLPLEIQNDINAEPRKQVVDPLKRVRIDHDSFKRPSLGDACDIKDVLTRLDNWLTVPIIEYSRDKRKISPPDERDVKEIKMYLERMVEGMFLYEVRVLLDRGDGGVYAFREGEDVWVFDEWVETWNRIKMSVEGCIGRKHGGRLKLRKKRSR
jgi:hypothetical protein